MRAWDKSNSKEYENLKKEIKKLKEEYNKYMELKLFRKC